MAKLKIPTSTPKPKTRKAITQEDRENQIISATYDLVEERIRNGTATSQETTFFLKLGCSKEKLEVEKLKRENELLEAKAKAIQDSAESSELYQQAIEAMKRYKGINDED